MTTIELDRQDKRNALNEDMVDGLGKAFADAVDAGARALSLIHI